jgi:hypothetical protein
MKMVVLLVQKMVKSRLHDKGSVAKVYGDTFEERL